MAGSIGIAFIGGEGPPPDFARALVEAARMETGTVLIAAADSGLAAAEAAGIAPDWIVGDMDSLDDPKRLEKYPSDRVLVYNTDKDYTDTELAITLLCEKGCAEVWLAGGGGDRLDHLLALRGLFERPICPRRWITAREAVFCVEAPGAKTAPGAFFVTPDALVSVFPAGSGPWKASSRGLKWPLDKVDWTPGFAGISNTAPDGKFEILAEAGRFLVILPLANLSGLLQV